MKVRHYHKWDVSYAEAVTIQKDLATRLVFTDNHCPAFPKYIAGADISYSKGDNLFFAAVVVLDYRSMDLVEESTSSGRVDFPYIPGLLSFREGPLLLKAFEKLRLEPDIIIFDGQGIAHPRGIGLASHLGLFLDTPSVGCAKTKLTGTCETPEDEFGASSPILQEGSLIGAALRTKKSVKPVYVSPGYKIGLNSALDIVLSCTRGFKLPEPTRKAHLAVNRIRLAKFT
jgi:deoxyribonuclease V